MLKIIDICNQIAEKLESHESVTDFRVVLRGNENLYVYILFPNSNFENEDTIEHEILSLYKDTEIEILDENIFKEYFGQELTNWEEKIILDHGKIRLNYDLKSDVISHQSKIITFYSYKGGMGRSTTLASFALFLAIHKSQNVFIIDCDIEAPGLNNFFLRNPGENNQQNGLIEYIFDKKCNLSDKTNLLHYTRQVESSWTGKGKIRVMHAGNMAFYKDDDGVVRDELSDFIQGISRLDLNTPDFSTKLIGDVISDIEDVYKPDVILIDSRTGINDVFGIAVSKMSDFVVGFFRNDVQSVPGLTYFVNEVYKNNLLPNTFIINAILPNVRSVKESMLSNFKRILSETIEVIVDEETGYEIYPIQRNETLELVGSSNEDLDDLRHLILDNEFKDYKVLFSAISEKMVDVPDVNKFSKKISEINEEDKPSTFDKSNSILDKVEQFSADAINKLNSTDREEEINVTRKVILNIFSENLNNLDLYAENISILKDFQNRKFYLRNCMKDLFNLDKYVIIGSKGTGKSYLYQALKEPEIVKQLKIFSQQDSDFHFIEAVNKNNKILTVSKIGLVDLNEEEKYRFWIIYTWQVLALWWKDFFIKEKYNAMWKPNEELLFNKFGDNSQTIEWIKSAIRDVSYIAKIEDEFTFLDGMLKENFPSVKITILYDQLDEMVDPELWDCWIPSLIRIWRNKRFNHIFGKLFLRKDLFNKVVGITNKNDVLNHAIDIEWTREEIYSYLLQTLFYPDRYDTLWKIMYLYDQDNLTIITQCRNHQNKVKSEHLSLPILDDYYLKWQIETLFGQYVRTKRKEFNQKSYDWFFNNLKNADNTISLRPFISLLQAALKNWKEGKYREEENLYPVLYQQYYCEPEVRKNAVSQYFSDLVENETGNMPIKYVFEYITELSKKDKKITMKSQEFYGMLKNVILQNCDKNSMEGMTTEKLANLLVNNGIVAKVNYGRGFEFRFAFLYKYTLGLRGN